MASGCSPRRLAAAFAVWFGAACLEKAVPQSCAVAFAFAWLLLVAPVECSEQRRPLPVRGADRSDIWADDARRAMAVNVGNLSHTSRHCQCLSRISLLESPAPARC